MTCNLLHGLALSCLLDSFNATTTRDSMGGGVEALSNVHTMALCICPFQESLDQLDLDPLTGETERLNGQVVNMHVNQHKRFATTYYFIIKNLSLLLTNSLSLFLSLSI